MAEGLRRRKAAGNGPITILSCDNLQHNGNTARKAFMTFVEAQDAELAAWMKENVTFPNSMVDRITPATRPDDPWLTAEDWKLIESDNELDFLGVSAFTSTDLKAAPHFVTLYQKMVEDVKAKGAMKVLEEEIL